MAITWPDVVAIAPELAATDPTAQTAILAIVSRQVADPDAWGSYFDDAAKYLAAHYGTLSRSRGKGPISDESVGQLSRSYAPLLQFGMLGQTAYGVEYQRLSRLTPAALGAVF